MSTPVRLPRIDQAASEARIVSWAVAPGVPVRAGDVVAVVETDKTEVDVLAPCDGILGPHLVAVDDVHPVGAVLALIEPARRPVSPRARALAAEAGVDLASVASSGPGSLVTEADVRAAMPVDDAPRLWRGRRIAGRVPLSPVRAAIARSTAAAWTTVPHFVQMVDADMSAARELRQRVPATYNDLVVAALADAIAADPQHRNVAFDSGEVVQLASVDIGIAVDTPDGLVVPVVRDVDRLGLAALAAASRSVIERARAGTLGAEEQSGGSATVSNLGAYGIRAGTPVLNAPEPVLVFAGSVDDRAVVVDGAIVVRPVMTLSIAYDHRVFDGATAAGLTGALRAWLEHPPDSAGDSC